MEDDEKLFQSGSLFADGIFQLNDSDVYVRRVSIEDVGDRKYMWRNMVTTHWPRLLRFGGFSTEGRLVKLGVVLSCLNLSMFCSI